MMWSGASISICLSTLFFLCASSASSAVQVSPVSPPPDYGVDTSTPIHRYLDNKNQFFKDKYDKMLEGCFALYSKRECVATENDRLEMNLDQPKGQPNYTDTGFALVKTPESVWAPLQEFYKKYHTQMKVESWPRGYTYVNNWDAPSYMINLERFPGGEALKELIWKNCQPVLEAWTGEQLEPTSLYGIRQYTTGSVLATHVDRLPLVSSAIIQVAQDLNEPWPIEVYDHQGKAHNVTMTPGDMILYESHTVLHGRPFPLNGSFYANLFIHYQPIEHNEQLRRLTKKQSKNLRGHTTHHRAARSHRHHAAHSKEAAGHEVLNHDPESIRRHMALLEEDSTKVFAPGSNEELIHMASQAGNLEALETLLDKDPSIMESRDENSWTPLHEAVRNGHLHIIKYLISKGADLGAETIDGYSVLTLARQILPPGAETIKYLESIDAPDGKRKSRVGKLKRGCTESL